MKVAVIGGDKRMLFAARAFLKDGCEVSIAGFDHLISLCDIRIAGAEEAAAWADMVVLPVRPVSSGCLSAPFSEQKAEIGPLVRSFGDKPVFTGCADQIRPFASGGVYDYAAREDFTVRNAELTAEGAIGLILSEYEGSVYGSKILVLGYGRIGKVLSADLRAMGADVTVAARKLSDRAQAGIMGLTAVDYMQIEYADYDIVYNTVPAKVLDVFAIGSMREDVYIVDLASAPGGVDFSAARDRGLSCVHALSLPGKTAPLAAGKIIKETIFSMIKEENGGKDHFGLCDDRLLLHL